MGAKLLRNGHSDILNYRIGFFNTALEELNDYYSEQIRYNALSHRVSKLDQQDFDKFMREDDDQPNKPKKIVVDHQAQMTKSKRIDNA